MIGGSNRVVNLRSLWHKIQTIVVYRICSVLFYYVSTRPPQDVDVIAVLDFQIPCFRPETPALYPRSLLTNHEKRTPTTTLGTGKRASMIQDGEDVDVLRSLAFNVY